MLCRHVPALYALLAAFALSGPLVAQEDHALNVLFLHGAVVTTPPGSENIFALRAFLPDEHLQDLMAAEKIGWTATRFSTQLTLDYLKQFNVVVLLDFPVAEKHAEVQDQVRAAEAALLEYVKSGGGLLAMGITEYGMWGLERGTTDLDRMLQPYDAQVLSEQVVERDKGLVLPSFGDSALAWTGNVQPHAITEGVRGLLYPVDYAWAYYTHPLKVGPEWQVLVKGSPSAATVTAVLGKGGPTAHADEKAGTIKSEPPLAAVRQLDDGRVALWPTIPSPYVIDAYHPFWGAGLTMEGTGDKPSDGRKLLFNLFRWLGEPSRGKFGTVAVKPPAVDLGDEPGFQKPDWDKVKLEGDPFPYTYRGLIGLQSNLSVGQDSPEALLAAARGAGYQFAAFTEDLAKLTPEKWAQLVKLCQAASGDQFQAYAGYAYRDASGNQWTTFGPQLGWPEAAWFVPGKPGTILKNNFIFRGFQYQPVILTDAGHNPEPPWFQGNFKGMAVVTLQGGKVVDDASQTYLELQDRGFDLVPLVVNFTRSAADVKAAAGAPWQSYVRWWELPNVINALAGNVAMHHGNYVFHRSAFVSGGPLLRDFRIYNFGSADLALAENDRYRIRVSLQAPAGLKEVALWDGPRLWRRMLLAGDKEWAGEFEGYQDKNRQFVVTATDTRGGKLVSNVGWTDIQEMHVVRCTDNLNTYDWGKYETVKFWALRGLESYIDRQAGNAVLFPLCWQPETERNAVDQQLPLVSRFGWIKDDALAYFYPSTASANWNSNDQPELAQPQTLWRGTTRQTVFAPWADSSVVFLVEGDYEVLRDQEVPQGKVAVLQTPWIKDATTVLTVPRQGPPTAKVLGLRSPYQFGSLDNLDYVAQMAPPGGSRAIIPLQEGLGYGAIYNREGTATLNADVPLPDKQLTRGQRLRYRYLVVWDTVQGQPDNSFVEKVVTTLGLRGTPAYTVQPTHGKVLDTKFALRLQAEGYGFAGTISQAKLPLNLPVLVSGLNERWPAGILYRGKNTLQVPTWRFNRTADRYSERVATPGANQLQRFAIEGDTGMLQVDTAVGDKSVYVGNLLVCERPEVFLALEDARPGKAVIMANNPLDEPVTVTIKPGPGFDLLGDFAKTVTLPAGGVVRVRLE